MNFPPQTALTFESGASGAMTTMTWLSTTAPVSQLPKPGWEPHYFLASLLLIGVLLGGALILYLVDRWRRRVAERRLDVTEQLAAFRKTYERGEMSGEEFDKVRTLLTEQLRQELSMPPPRPSAGSAPVEPETRPAPQSSPGVEPPQNP